MSLTSLTPIGKMGTTRFIIESPSGKKIIILPLSAFYPTFGPQNMLDEQEQLTQFGVQIIDAAAEFDECKTYINNGFNDAEFLKALKDKGYKIYWMEY